jgi:acetoin utilization deacetylase AcuC-like enzyme
MALESASFGRFAAEITALTQELDIAPPALVLEGGYNLDALAESVAATIEGVQSTASPDWVYSGDVKAVEAARQEHSEFWEVLR